MRRKHQPGCPCCGPAPPPPPPPDEPVACGTVGCEIPNRAMKLRYVEDVGYCTECDPDATFFCKEPLEIITQDHTTDLVYFPTGTASGWSEPIWAGRINWDPVFEDDPCAGCRSIYPNEWGYWFVLRCSSSNNRWELLRFASGTNHLGAADPRCEKEFPTQDFPICECWYTGVETIDYFWPTIPPPLSASYVLVGSIAGSDACECVDFTFESGKYRLYDPECA